MTRYGEFLQRGFLTFPAEPALFQWASAARPVAARAARDPSQSHCLRCGGTWFVGLDALPNDTEGRIGGGVPLEGAAMHFLRNELSLALPLHRAQVSVCYPGYPLPSPQESEAAYRFRLKRDAAHVDGLLAEGPEKRRTLKEPHAYILGVALTAQSAGAAPLTVWEGSHRIMRRMFGEAFNGHAPEAWATIDVTQAYQEARRTVFATCGRVELPLLPGEAVLLHRHLVHGVAPWGKTAQASEDGRMIAYFRPELPALVDWLTSP